MKKQISLFIFAITLFQFSGFIKGAIPASERAALIALYNSTNGDGWRQNYRWKTAPLYTDGFAMPGTEGIWRGVTVWQGHVSVINLGDNNLSGSIPSELGNLSNLITLNVWGNNQLDGSIPSELGNLSSLRYLALDDNNLRGNIPSELGNLSNLEELYLTHNQLSGEIPSSFTKLANIFNVRLEFNCLSAIDPAIINWLNIYDPYWEYFQNNCTGITTPTVTTNTVSAITSSEAVCGGNVTSDGGAIITTRGVCWSKVSYPTISNSKTTNGTGMGSFTSNITGLTANTPYYVRAYATNSMGTSYGVNRSFTTGSGGILPEINPPFGSFDTPVDGSKVAGSIAVTGWALDDSGVASVTIYRSQGNSLVYIGDALFVEGARPDVAAAYPQYPFNTKAGWGYMMLTNFFPGEGNGAFVLSAIATDTVGKKTILGTKTIIVDNAHAVKPFGAIDTPTQGGTATGSSFVNWGWVLTHQPNSIPTNGSSINVYVNGVNKGHPTYNIYRSDIATLFTGYANSNGAIGYFYLDTTKYADGVHTIQWTAADNGGKSDGIGSRYFTIQNTGSDSAQGVCTRAMNIQQISTLPGDFSEPTKFYKGFNTDNECQELLPDEKGKSQVVIKELERVEIQLGENYAEIQGYLINSNELNKLPTGSTLDAKSGTFSWSPGPGFLGSYSLVFVLIDSNGQSFKKSIEIKIEPKFNGIK